MADIAASVLARLKNKAAESGRNYIQFNRRFFIRKMLRNVQGSGRTYMSVQ